MYIIIPAYEPDKRLIQVVQDITIKLPKARIIVVNDGSGPGYNDYYDETAFIGATVLTHPINKGKGAALKTAFAHIQEEVVSQHLSAQLFALTKNLLLSVVLARVISASSQCLLNANVVFNPTSSLFRSSVRYFMLVLVLLACNYFLLSSLVAIGLGLVLAKLVTETLLFLVSYRVQHNVVFA